MNIEKAREAAKLLKQKEEIEEFFNNIKNLPGIKTITVQVNLVGEDGRLNPCVGVLTPEIALPCLKEELEGIKRALKAL